MIRSTEGGRGAFGVRTGTAAAAGLGTPGGSAKNNSSQLSGSAFPLKTGSVFLLGPKEGQSEKLLATLDTRGPWPCYSFLIS
jgi:hypothetical protein